jgi:plastocyanin
MHLPIARSRIGAIAILALLVGACSGSGAPTLTFTPTGSNGTGPVATATASPSATATASPTATASATDDHGGSSTPSPTGTPGAAIDPRTDGLDVTFGEYAITLEAAVIRPGPVTFVVHNAGMMTHGFEMQLDSSGKGGGDRQKIETRTFRSGENLRVEANLPAGVYEIECYVSNHASLGMRTTLAVRADAPLLTPNPSASAAGTVRIVQFAFVAASLDVAVGTRVTWTNDDPAPHTVTADAGAFDSKQLDPSGSFSVVFDRVGTFAYHCEIHPTMVGTVAVH